MEGALVLANERVGVGGGLSTMARRDCRYWTHSRIFSLEVRSSTNLQRTPRTRQRIKQRIHEKAQLTHRSSILLRLLRARSSIRMSFTG
jgi:hypothetical protein